MFDAVSPVPTTAFLTCLAAQCSGPSSALDTAVDDNSATARIAYTFFIVAYICDVPAAKVIRC